MAEIAKIAILVNALTVLENSLVSAGIKKKDYISEIFFQILKDFFSGYNISISRQSAVFD